MHVTDVSQLFSAPSFQSLEAKTPSPKSANTTEGSVTFALYAVLAEDIHPFKHLLNEIPLQ